jgi:predicted nuclease of predicted toxin-antitoxin system
VSLGLYMDVHVRQAVTDGLRRRGVDVLTAQEDNAAQLLDDDLLDRAITLGRVLFSQDEDLLREAARRQRSGEVFAGLIYTHQRRITDRQCIDELELLAQIEDPEAFRNRVEYLPL